MDNYHYIITGLPNIVPELDNRSFSYKTVRDSLYEKCSEEDRKLIEFLELGFDGESLTEEFYSSTAVSKNRFIREYFAFDNEVRNIKVIRLAERFSLDAEKYIVGKPDYYFGDKSKIHTILNNDNIIEREKLLDKLLWDKVNEITAFDFFNVEVILAFLIKAHITDRWCKMDKTKGAEFFKQLVNEVRGTFKGVGSF